MAPLDETDGGCRFPIAFRGLLAAAQIATVLLTWKLWIVRASPPLLPLVPLPPCDMGWPMLAAIAASFFAPRRGLPLQAAVLSWAIVADQSRLQPQMLSMLCLSCGTLPGSRGGVLIARASLIALWLFSGLHKLTSPAFFTETMPWLLGSVGLPRNGMLALLGGAAVGGVEMLLGIGCLAPPLRRAVAVTACAVHATIIIVLSPLGIDWNPEVLPWNAALACAGFALVAPWRDRPPGIAWRHAARPARIAAAAILVGPAGWWLGVVDASLAHCLYSNDTPRAFVCTPFARRDIAFMCLDEGIRVPPAHRLFEPLFRGLGRPGEWLEIEDPRWVARWRGLAPRTIRYSPPAVGPERITMPLTNASWFVSSRRGSYR